MDKILKSQALQNVVWEVREGQLLTASELLEVPEKESGSPLVSVREQLPFLKVKYEKEDMLTYTGEDIFVRADLIPMLENAFLALQAQQPGYNFLIRYGYRHPEVQKKYYEARYRFHQTEHPNYSEEQLIELTHTQVALPAVAGHPTGGAIDLTIINAHGNELDMGTNIADYSHPDKCFTYADSVSDEQSVNRVLLANLMIDAGFASYIAEWWHFSYGDREWARLYGRSHSLFGQINYRKGK